MEQLRCVLGFLVYFIGYSSSVDYDTVTNLGEGCNWEQAIKACESRGRSLPEVPILRNGFGQINIRHENRCIWVKATYERAHNLTDYSYPNSCCELMFRDKNDNAQNDCVFCKQQYGYMCATGSNTISLEYTNNVKQAPWRNADHECGSHSLRLPSDTNTEFLQYLTHNNSEAMWINGVRTLNTNPNKSDGMFPLCSCNGFVSLACPNNTWTYCLLDPKNEGRTESSYLSTPVSFSSNVPNPSSGNLEASRDSSNTATAKEYYTVISLGEGFPWKQAMKTCESKGRSLPEVPILRNGFGQINLQHENRCIWLKATYERAHNMTDYSYPYSCCDLMFRDKMENAQKDCVSCRGQNGYLCASGSNTIWLEYSNNVKQAPWRDADHECITHSLGLPSDTNTEFLQHLTYNIGAMWINGVRTLNTNPTKSDGMFPLCSCNGIVTLICPSNTWTYCLLESLNEGRSGSSYFTTQLSTSSNVPKLSSGNLEASRDSSINATTKESMSTERFWTPYFTSPLSSSLIVSKLSTENQHDASTLDTKQTTRCDVKENWTLSGIIIGILSTLLLLALMILLVIALKLRRILRFVQQKGKSQEEFAQLDLSSAYQTLNNRSNQAENVYNTLKIDSNVS